MLINVSIWMKVGLLGGVRLGVFFIIFLKKNFKIKFWNLFLK